MAATETDWSEYEPERLSTPERCLQALTLFAAEVDATGSLAVPYVWNALRASLERDIARLQCLDEPEEVRSKPHDSHYTCGERIMAIEASLGALYSDVDSSFCFRKSKILASTRKKDLSLWERMQRFASMVEGSQGWFTDTHATHYRLELSDTPIIPRADVIQTPDKIPPQHTNDELMERDRQHMPALIAQMGDTIRASAQGNRLIWRSIEQQFLDRAHHLTRARTALGRKNQRAAAKEFYTYKLPLFDKHVVSEICIASVSAAIGEIRSTARAQHKVLCFPFVKDMRNILAAAAADIREIDAQGTIDGRQLALPATEYDVCHLQHVLRSKYPQLLIKKAGGFWV